MANLPAKRPESAELETRDRYLEAIADQIAAGRRPNEIARRIHPNDPRKRKLLRGRLWHMLWHDAELANKVAMRARGEFLLALVPATHALAGRAVRTGRPDAVKLLYEASGFHNPRVQHQHSGEIKVKLEIPRPTFDGEVSDAEVVD